MTKLLTKSARSLITPLTKIVASLADHNEFLNVEICDELSNGRTSSVMKFGPVSVLVIAVANVITFS